MKRFRLILMLVWAMAAEGGARAVITAFDTMAREADAIAVVDVLSVRPAKADETDQLASDLANTSKTITVGPKILYQLSAVAFNPSHTRALVSVSYACGDHCGGENHYFFVKVKNKWIRDEEYRGELCASAS